MLFSYQKTEKSRKNPVVQINSFIVDILINEVFVITAFVDIKCFCMILSMTNLCDS